MNRQQKLSQKLQRLLSIVLTIAVFLVTLPSTSWSQGGNTLTITGTGAPSGTCSFIMYYINASTGDFYNCKSSAWNLVGGSGGVISGLSTNVIPKASSGTALTNSSITDNLVVSSTEFFRPINACRLTTDTALSTSATNICSFSLPASALGWAWQCDILWNVTAGTTPTIAIGVNPSQTPTATTNGYAEIKTSNANAATEGTAAISASGATSLLTSGTLTPAATIFSATTFGTIAASGTAGTFAITMTGTGASFAGNAKAGTACYLY